MADKKIYDIQRVNEDGQVIENLCPATLSEAVIYNDTEPVVQAIGGISAGKTYPDSTVQQVIYDLLHPYVKPTISLTATPNGGVKEKGTSISSITLNATCTKKSANIAKVEFLDGSTIINTQANSTGASGTVQFIYNSSYNGTVNKTLKARVTDVQNGSVDSNSISYTFVYPAYVGSIDTGVSVPTQAQIKAMTKKVQNKANISNSYTITNKRMCIATPPQWTISKIIDPNGFDITSSFTKHNVEVTCNDTTTQQYSVYVSEPTTQTAFNVTFNA